ncbi:MAG: ExbD/TolR family protein [Planctomycetota bacterium]|jgi:biopolymer transport protein ExbD
MAAPFQIPPPDESEPAAPVPEARTAVRRRRRRREARIGLNLTAMIDVVFLLLVYFMAATQFKLGEEIYRLDLPRRGAPADPFVLPRDPLRIVLVSTGPACLIRLPGPYTQPADFQELHGFLRENRRAVGVIGGLFEADHPIIIEPTGTTRWEHAMEAFNAAVRAQYSNVTFAPPA